MKVLHVIAASALTLGAACTNDEEMPTPQEGAVLFADNCTACHGYRGTGSETLAGGQSAPDLTRISARNNGDFPRAEVLSQIDGFGHKNVPKQVMPEFGTLLTGETVPVDIDGIFTPTPRPLAALLAFLESIQIP